MDKSLLFLKQGESQTVEQLLSENYSSQTRNRAAVRAFKKVGIIEKYGSRIARIQSECKKHGKVEVKFEGFQHGFKTILKKIDKNTNEGVKSLYELIKNNSNKKTPFFGKEINTFVKNIERWIEQLRDEGKIEFKGAPKTGGYALKVSDAN